MKKRAAFFALATNFGIVAESGSRMLEDEGWRSKKRYSKADRNWLRMVE
jgi:hypothetical protein